MAKHWICNPLKNKECKKDLCGIIRGIEVSCKGWCFLTTKEKNALHPSDMLNHTLVGGHYKIDKWLKQYYGKEEEVCDYRDGW